MLDNTSEKCYNLNMKILGIETSCDDTTVAIVEDGRKVLSSAVATSAKIFAAYGGVIPEVAARSHLEAMLPTVHEAMNEANCTWDDIDAIAVTHTPGLLGSLLIGTLTARTLAILHNKPLYAVHHLKSHIYANWLKDGKLPEFPLLSLVVSGGHTQIISMNAHNHFEIIGTTHDDAIGECFDKVAKILGLAYPGGPNITAAASGKFTYYTSDITVDGQRESKIANIEPGDPNRYKFPHPKVENLDFSFSGLKTAVLRAIQKELDLPISSPSSELYKQLTPRQISDFAASFQKTAVDIVIEKLQAALIDHPAKSVVIAGGVSANQLLREETARRLGLPVFFPEAKYSGDNGAMVASAAYYEIESGVEPTDPYSLNISPRSILS